MAMTLENTLARLESIGTEKVRAQNKKNGTGNIDARLLAILLIKPKNLSRDYPVSKGCTSPFAPIWINEMVRRQSRTIELSPTTFGKKLSDALSESSKRTLKRASES